MAKKKDRKKFKRDGLKKFKPCRSVDNVVSSSFDGDLEDFVNAADASPQEKVWGVVNLLVDSGEVAAAEAVRTALHVECVKGQPKMKALFDAMLSHDVLLTYRFVAPFLTTKKSADIDNLLIEATKDV